MLGSTILKCSHFWHFKNVKLSMNKGVLMATHNKKIKFARCAGWDANIWAAHFVRILAHVLAPQSLAL